MKRLAMSILGAVVVTMLALAIPVNALACNKPNGSTSDHRGGPVVHVVKIVKHNLRTVRGRFTALIERLRTHDSPSRVARNH